MPHKHEFVPVEIAWLKFWSRINEDKLPVAKYVIKACTCGAIRLVPAKRVRIEK